MLPAPITALQQHQPVTYKLWHQQHGMRPKIKSKQMKRDDKMHKYKPSRVPAGIAPLHSTNWGNQGTRTKQIDPEGN